MPWSMVLWALLLATAPCAGGEAPAGGQLPAEASKADPLLESLEGADTDKGALAARDLLSQIVDKKSPRSAEYLKYLRGALDPDRLVQGGTSNPVAERLVAALAYLAGAGQPFPPEGAELILKLIGSGPEGIRKAVREAVISIARSEARSGSSSTIQILEEMLQPSSQPKPLALEEISTILWRVNGKELLKSLVGILSKSKSRPRDELGPYFFALRTRLGIDFSKIEEWEKWWVENQESPIELILEKAYRQARERQSELWRRILRRIETTLDPEAYLGAIADCLELNPTQELRAAAVESLGGFPAWLRDSKFPPDKSGAPTVDDAKKAAFASRGLGLILDLLNVAESRGAVSPAIRQKSLAALRSYGSHLEKNPQDETAVAAVLLAGFQRIFPDGIVGTTATSSSRSVVRADLLELVKTSGVLRIPSARTYLERILREEESQKQPDLELVLEAIGALGRILERGVLREPVDLILRYYRANKDPSDRAQRDIRKACVLALNLRFQEAALRDEIRRFYDSVLASAEDRACWVPAILGLGILAKGGDLEASASLVAVLSRRERFDPAEAAAAVDAISYLGGREALEQLLPYIDVKDPAFAEHVWRRIVSILKNQGAVLFQWTLSRIVEQSWRDDKPEMVRFALRLVKEPEMEPLLSPERASSAGREDLVAFWKMSLTWAQALEIVGDEAGAAALLSTLNDVAIKNGSMKKINPQAEEELVREQVRLQRLVDARAVLSRKPQDPPEILAQELLKLLIAADPADGRWRRLQWVLAQLQSLKPSPESAQVVTLAIAGLGGAEGDAFWKGLLPGAPSVDVRGKYLKSLESLREKLKVVPPSAPGGSQ